MRISLVLFLSILLPSFVSAEDLEPDAVILPGSKIKIITNTVKATSRRNKTKYQYTVFKGHFLERFEDAFVIRTETEIYTIPNSDILELYTSNKTKMHFGTGFQYGAIIGAVSGAAFGYSEGPIQICIFGGCDPPSRSERIRAAFGFGIVFGLAGGIVGGVIGSFIRSDKWEEARTDQFQYSFLPIYKDRVGLSLSLRF